MSAGRGSRLDDVHIGSIHRLEGERTLICTSMCWGSGRADKVVFYEPATDKLNECSVDEVARMIELKQLVLHAPQKGRVIR